MSLLEQEKSFFTLEEAMNILESNDNITVRKLISDMVKRGLILRIKNGLYHPIPFEQKPEKYFPNWHLTAEALAQKKEYYIGFYSALDIHGLITQPSMVEQIVTLEHIKPKIQQVRNVRFEFITFSNDRFFGYKKHWIDDFSQVYCSDLEKTFLDCLYIPKYAGGIIEITKALYKGRNRINPDKLLEYLDKYDTQSVYKRLGFIVDQLELSPEILNFIAKKITSSFVSLDPTLLKKGKYQSKWKIVDNIDFKDAINAIRT